MAPPPSLYSEVSRIAEIVRSIYGKDLTAQVLHHAFAIANEDRAPSQIDKEYYRVFQTIVGLVDAAKIAKNVDRQEFVMFVIAHINFHKSYVIPELANAADDDDTLSDDDSHDASQKRKSDDSGNEKNKKRKDDDDISDLDDDDE